MIAKVDTARGSRKNREDCAVTWDATCKVRRGQGEVEAQPTAGAETAGATPWPNATVLKTLAAAAPFRRMLVVALFFFAHSQKIFFFSARGFLF